MIDLDKKLRVSYCGNDGNVHLTVGEDFDDPKPEDEEMYARLFEAAPRMLAWMKDVLLVIKDAYDDNDRGLTLHEINLYENGKSLVALVEDAPNSPT